MDLPLATIALSLAAAGLKIYGPHQALVEFIQHPLDLLAGHSGAHTLEQLGDRVRKWTVGTVLPENQDLERALTRCALLADLFCLAEGADRGLGADSTYGDVWSRFGLWLERPEGMFQGLTSEGVRVAANSKRERLNALELGEFRPVGIDATSLILPQTEDRSAGLAALALSTTEREYGPLPDTVRCAYRDRWFGYLCLAFHESLKSDDRLARIFSALQSAAGFERLANTVRVEASAGREQSRLHHTETWRRLDAIDRALDSRKGGNDEWGGTRTDDETQLPRALLRITDGTSTKEVPIDHTPLVIGRGANCDVSLPYQIVSSPHAELSFDQGRFWLKDRSKNGTFLASPSAENQKGETQLPLAVATPLVAGATFRVGRVRLELVLLDDGSISPSVVQ